MTDMSSKPKNGMPQTRKAWQGYAALLVALAVCFGFLLCFQKTTSFPYGDDQPVFYPLLILTHDPLLRTLFWGFTLAALIGLLLVAERRQVSCLITLLLMLPGVGALLFAFFIMLLSADITHRHTIFLDDRQYSLLLYSQEIRITEGAYSSKAYIVIECDARDLICHYEGTFHKIDAGEAGYDVLKNFDESGLLFVDETDRVLKLRVGTEVYNIDPWFDRPW